MPTTSATSARYTLALAGALAAGAVLSCDEVAEPATSPEPSAVLRQEAPAPSSTRSLVAADSSPVVARGTTPLLVGTLAATYPDSQVVNTPGTALYLGQAGAGQAAHFVAGQKVAGHFETSLNGAAFATVYAESRGTGSVVVAEKLGNGGNALRGVHFGNGTASFLHAMGNGAAVQALATGSGTTLIADKLSGSGGAARFKIESSANVSPVVQASTNGRGIAGYFTVNNSSTGGEAMRLASNGPGSTLRVTRQSTGGGSAAVIQSSSSQSTGSALLVNNAGAGFAATISAFGPGGGLRITTAGGAGLQVVGGVKNAVVATSSGARALYSEESSEVWFTDYGFARLVGGRARVTLEPTFAETVTLAGGYHVFVQSYGDAELVVRRRSDRGFEVERRDGTEDAEFSYRIVARRRGFGDVRMQKAPWADRIVRGASGVR